jgi:hypothetical protein
LRHCPIVGGRLSRSAVAFHADRPGFGLGAIGLTCGFDSAFARMLCLRLGELDATAQMCCRDLVEAMPVLKPPLRGPAMPLDLRVRSRRTHEAQRCPRGLYSDPVIRLIALPLADWARLLSITLVIRRFQDRHSKNFGEYFEACVGRHLAQLYAGVVDIFNDIISADRHRFLQRSQKFAAGDSVPRFRHRDRAFGFRS